MGNDISSRYDYSTVVLNLTICGFASFLLFHLPFRYTIALILWYLIIYIILFFVCLEENDKSIYIYQFVLMFYSTLIIAYSSYTTERYSRNIFKISLGLQIKSDEACRKNNAKSDYVNQLFHDVLIIIIFIIFLDSKSFINCITCIFSFNATKFRRFKRR